MSLRPEQLAALDRLLQRMLVVPAAERANWVDDLQGDDASLAPSLRDLLAQPGLLETEGVPDAWSLPLRAAIVGAAGVGGRFSAGQAIGPYRLLRPLGEGGMGVVWLAERADGTLRRQVALKLPRPGLKQWRLDERFERERDILGSLEHPHIARLYEAGVTPDGQPFLAMEFVAGRPITEQAEAAGLDVPARVRLFLQVLAAVQHAHQHLVVHRDLKPSNILVDEQGSVRLLDFGIAQLQDERAPQTALTEVGQAVLTPQYASPEQVAHAPVSTASDVYSLGVVLCELLSGRGPYAPARDTRAALEEAILQGDLQRPSQLAPVARRAALRGDLDNIVQKALQRDPAQRYASADALAQDLLRHLDGVPVLAHPDSLAYRARKFAARNRLVVAAGSAVALALLVGIGLALWQAGVARDQAARAGREAQRARAVQDFLVGLFDEADPARSLGREVTVRDLMKGAERDLPRLTKQPESQGAVRAAMVDIYLRLSDDARALALAQTQVQEMTRWHGAGSFEAALAIAALGRVQLGREDYAAALVSLREAQRLMTLQAHTHPGEALALAEDIASTLTGLHRAAEAVQVLSDALPQLEARYPAGDWRVVGAHSTLIVALTGAGRQAEALAEVRRIEPMLDAVDAAHESEAAVVRGNMGLALWQAGQWADAVRYARRTVADLDRLRGPRNTESLRALALIMFAQRDAGQLGPAYQSCVVTAERTREVLGTDADATNRQDANCAVLLLQLGRIDEGVALAERASRAAHGRHSVLPTEIKQLDRTLASAWLSAGRHDAALALLRSIAADERAKPQRDNDRAMTALLLSAALRLSGQAAAAAEPAAEAAAIWDARDNFSSRVQAGRALLQLALARAAMGAVEPAEAALADATKHLQAQLPADHPTLRAAELVRATLLRAKGQEAAAAALEREVRGQLKREGGIELPPGLPLMP